MYVVQLEREVRFQLYAPRRDETAAGMLVKLYSRRE